MKTLLSDRLLLTPLTAMEEAFIYILYSDPQILASYRQPPIPFKKESLQFIERITLPDNFVWLITLKATHEKLGICALHHWDKNHSVLEIGGTLLPEFWGMGIMQEAFNSLIPFASTELNIKTIIAKTEPANKKAIHMALKMGFKEVSNVDEETVLVYSI